MPATRTQIWDSDNKIKSHTTTERDALFVSDGIMVYNSEDDEMQGYNGSTSSWVSLTLPDDLCPEVPATAVAPHTHEDYAAAGHGHPDIPAGPKGDKGDKGDPGEPGEDGEDGAQGIQGIPGPQGPRGLTGPQGIQGPQGDPGPQGIGGVPGTPGRRGSQGPKGDKGDQGPAGTNYVRAYGNVHYDTGPRRSINTASAVWSGTENDYTCRVTYSTTYSASADIVIVQPTHAVDVRPIVSVNSLSYFEVRFYDSSDNKVKAPFDFIAIG